MDYAHPGTVSNRAGPVLHFQDIENYMFGQVISGASDTVALYKVVAGHPTLLATGGSFTLRGSDTVKCVITESGGDGEGIRGSRDRGIQGSRDPESEAWWACSARLDRSAPVLLSRISLTLPRRAGRGHEARRHEMGRTRIPQAKGSSAARAFRLEGG